MKYVIYSIFKNQMYDAMFFEKLFFKYKYKDSAFHFKN